MKAITLLALLVAAPVLAWDTVLWDSSKLAPAPTVESGSGLYVVDIANRSKRTNPEYREWMSIIGTPALASRKTKTGIPWLGSVTASVAAIERDAPAARKLREFLGTNTYARAVRAERDVISVARTNDVTAARRAMAKAILDLDKLRSLKDAARYERLRLGIRQDDEDVEETE